MRILLIISTISWAVYGQNDGNPHGWDRKRRCDHQGYEPPCGVCEGYGGIPWGDRNEDIVLTTCEAIFPPDEIDQSTLIRPQWGTVWNVSMAYEIIIGKKKDPFCFQTLPEPDSIGELCYKEHTGSKFYDMETARAYRQDLNVKTILGNVSSIVIHQGTNFWSVNKFASFPFFGIHQCLCLYVPSPTSPKPSIYPVQYDWVDQLQFVGREILGVEYIQETLELDHWSLGPHHVWSHPDNGQIVRMWQPYNGLQIYLDKTQGIVDPSKFEDIPPELCKSGGALIRTGCDDDGYPVPQENSKKKAIMEKDHFRAKNKVPGHNYKGMDFQEMSIVLNQWLNSSSVKVRACEQFDVEELQRLQAILYLMKEDHFDSIYQSTGDNRRIRHDVLNENHWMSLNKLAKEHRNPMMKRMRRDGHCHEAVMWYVHHLTEDLKEVLSGLNIEIPLLSHMKHECNSEDVNSVEGQICKAYEDQITCANCHSNVLP